APAAVRCNSLRNGSSLWPNIAADTGIAADTTGGWPVRTCSSARKSANRKEAGTSTTNSLACSMVMGLSKENLTSCLKSTGRLPSASQRCWRRRSVEALPSTLPSQPCPDPLDAQGPLLDRRLDLGVAGAAQPRELLEELGARGQPHAHGDGSIVRHAPDAP